MPIEYSVTDEKEIDLIEPLWRKLNELHGSLSRYFAGDYPDRTWELRKKELLNQRENVAMRVDLARDTDTGELVGYCVSSVTEDGTGEIDSIYVEADYRRCGIGDYLMTNALSWMDKLPVKRRIVQVADGNEDVHTFYRKHGFYPRATILMQVEPEESDDIEEEL